MDLKRVKRTLAQHISFVAGQTVIVAVSGGCDSVALLHLLQRCSDCLGINLHVASLNHGLRPEAAQKDLEFVADLASRWRIPYTVGQENVPRLAQEWRVGIEEAARRARYDFLARVAQERGSAFVALGHHALDQAETIIMNIARGSGLGGLCGMKTVSEMPNHSGLRLIRPLLPFTKVELESYCLRHNLPFQVDDSNNDIRYTRNFVRHELIGRMARLNPDLLGAFGRLAESAAVDEAFMIHQFESIVLPMTKVSANRWRIGLEDFAALHPALQRRFLREAYGQLSGRAAALPHARTLELIAWSRKAQTGSRRDIGAGLQMRVSYDEICIERADAAEARSGLRLIPADTNERIVIDRPLVFPDLRVELLTDLTAKSAGARLLLPAGLELRLRTRRQGDRFKPKGMAGRSRKLKSWMIDRKIPQALRDRIPLVCVNGEIIAICLADDWRLAHQCRSDRGSAPCVMLILT